jgi:hypothetical protein
MMQVVVFSVELGSSSPLTELSLCSERAAGQGGEHRNLHQV